LKNRKVHIRIQALKFNLDQLNAAYLETTRDSVTDEVIDDQNLANVPAKSIAIWNLSDNKFFSQWTPSFEFENLFCIDKTFAWDIYKFPKIINLVTGQIVDKAEDVYSGEQKSSILFDIKKQPQISFDLERKRLAIKYNDRVLVLTRE
jgi:hypothetical protein